VSLGLYRIVWSRFWTGPTGRAIQQKGKDATILSRYLVYGPHANSIGLYELPLGDVEHECFVLGGRLPILRALHDLHVLEFATYDMGTEHVWVREMARIQHQLQLNELIAANDRRHHAILKQYRNARPNPFLGPFFERYTEQLRLPEGRIGPPLRPVSKAIADADARALQATRPQAPCGNVENSDSRSSPLEAPSKGFRQVQKQVQKAGSGSGSGSGTGKAAAAPRDTPPEHDDPDRNIEVITSLILKEIFPVLGTSAEYAEVSDATKSRCATLGIAYDGAVVRKAIESALFRARLKRAVGGSA